MSLLSGSQRRYLLISQVFGQLAPIVVLPLLTRILNPEQMGLYQVAFSISIIALPFALLQSDVLVPIARNIEQVRRLRRLTIAATLLVSSMSALGAFFLVSQGSHETALTTALLVVALSVTSFSSATLIRTGDSKSLIRRNLFGGGLVASFQVIAALFHPTALALGIGMILGRLTCITLVRSHRAFEPHSSDVTGAYGFWKILSGASANALGAFGSQMPMLIVAPIFGAAAAGHLGLGQRVVGGPVGLVGQGVNQIFTADSASILRSREAFLWPKLRRPLGLLMLTALLAALALGTIVPPITPWIFGASWAPAGKYIQILALPMCLQLVAIPMVPLLAMLGLQSLVFALQIFRVLGIAACAIIGIRLSWSMLTTVMLISIIWTLAYCLTIWVAIRAIHNYDAKINGIGHGK